MEKRQILYLNFETYIGISSMVVTLVHVLSLSQYAENWLGFALYMKLEMLFSNFLVCSSISFEQHGSVDGISAVASLFSVMQHTQVDGVYSDMVKACNKIDHEVWLHKLWFLEFSVCLLLFFH